MSTPPVVRLDVWGVSGLEIARSFLRMGSQRRAVTKPAGAAVRETHGHRFR